MRRLAYTGFVISLAGSVLDFVSGYYSMGQMAPQPGAMASFPPSSISLFVLGAVVLLGGALLVIPRTANKMRELGFLMEALGVVMALVSYLVPGMDLGLAYAMLLVGGAMILNGALMQRREPAAGGM